MLKFNNPDGLTKKEKRAVKTVAMVGIAIMGILVIFTWIQKTF